MPGIACLFLHPDQGLDFLPFLMAIDHGEW